MKAANKQKNLAMVTLEEFLDARQKTRIRSIVKCSKESCYLTKDKENMVFHIAKLMAGMGISKDTCPEIINSILLSRGCFYINTSVHVLDLILKNTKTLLTLISNNAIDSARVH